MEDLGRALHVCSWGICWWPGWGAANQLSKTADEIILVRTECAIRARVFYWPPAQHFPAQDGAGGGSLEDQDPHITTLLSPGVLTVVVCCSYAAFSTVFLVASSVAFSLSPHLLPVSISLSSSLCLPPHPTTSSSFRISDLVLHLHKNQMGNQIWWCTLKSQHTGG